MIKLENITKDFISGDDIAHVLRGVSMEINDGEMTIISGPSGCGKTTLLSIIAGILSSTSGKIVMDGQDVTNLKEREKAAFRRNNIGFVFQQFNLLPSLNAMENAAIPLVAAGMSMKSAIEVSEQLLKKLEMGAHLKKLPNQLSGGQQQRVAIARALVHNPKVIVCDEPTSALDANTGHHIMELLRDIAIKPKQAVIVVTHDPRILEFGNRIIHMDDGLVVKEEKTGKK